MNIQELIGQAGKHLRDEFEHIKNTNPHYAERGTESEIILADFLHSISASKTLAITNYTREGHYSRFASRVLYDLSLMNTQFIFSTIAVMSSLPQSF